MAGFKKVGCGPIGLVVLVVIVFGVMSDDDDDEPPLSPSQSVVTRSPTAGANTAGSPITPMSRYVTADTLNIRAAPATNSQVIRQVTRGAQVTLTRQDGAWYGVPLSDGSIGWLHGDYLANRQPAAPSRLVGGPTSRPAAASSNCHPSYVGYCLPMGRNVDCPDLPGSVSVVGPDVYRLDRDNDGVGCE